MNKLLKNVSVLFLLLLLISALAIPALADSPAAGEDETATEETADNSLGLKAIAAAIAVGLAATGGAVSMGMSTAKAAESIARQPEAEGKIRTTLMLGLVFIETAIIYALLAVILIIFVL